MRFAAVAPQPSLPGVAATSAQPYHTAPLLTVRLRNSVAEVCETTNQRKRLTTKSADVATSAIKAATKMTRLARRRLEDTPECRGRRMYRTAGLVSSVDEDGDKIDTPYTVTAGVPDDPAVDVNRGLPRFSAALKVGAAHPAGRGWCDARGGHDGDGEVHGRGIRPRCRWQS